MRMFRDGTRYGQTDLPLRHQVSGTLGLAVMAGPDADVSSLLQAPTGEEHGKWMQWDMRVTRVYAGTLARETDRLAVVISEARASSGFSDDRLQQELGTEDVLFQYHDCENVPATWYESLRTSPWLSLPLIYADHI